jgi:type VI secretion system secreted protein Hcp
MPNPIYVWFKGATQGVISGHGSWTGEDDQKGREDSCLVHEFASDIEIPVDLATGQASGRRRHKPIHLSKRIDKASPKLFQALCTAEVLTEVRFEFYRHDQMGKQEKYYTIKLTQAVIVDMKQWFPITHDQSKTHYQHMESVSLTYRKIEWTWEKGGITSMDDWQTG